MRLAILLSLALVGAPAPAQQTAPATPTPPAAAPATAEAEAPVVAEARAFMIAYAADLERGDRAGIAARYDRRGAHFLGGGERMTMTHAQIVARYAGPDWTPPAAFEWRGLAFEPLGTDAVAITGQFAWTETAAQAPMVFSYTALLIREDGALRIRIEDEDAAPAPRR